MSGTRALPDHVRKPYMRVIELCEDAQEAMWAIPEEYLKAEHALREALQIIETLKESDTFKVCEAHRIDDEAAP